MAIANNWEIGGATIPTPSSWTWSYQDLSSEDSGRDMGGSMHKDVVAVKIKNECTWAYKTASVAKTIMTAAKNSVFVSLKYFDPFDGAARTATVYTGDITCTAEKGLGETLFTVSLSFIDQ